MDERSSEQNAATLSRIQSNDENVTCIEVGEGSDRERKYIKKGERISFMLPYTEQLDIPTGAFDQDGNKLYD